MAAPIPKHPPKQTILTFYKTSLSRRERQSPAGTEEHTKHAEREKQSPAETEEHRKRWLIPDTNQKTVFGTFYQDLRQPQKASARHRRVPHQG